MAENSVKVLWVIDIFMLSLYRRGLGDFYWNRPPGVMGFDSLRDCLDSIHILLSRSPRGRRHLKSLGPSIANFRFRR